MKLAILHTNDFHGTLDEAKAKRIREIKEARNALYFDCGDCIKTGNLGIPLKREKTWDLLAQAGCDAGTIGNRETHVLTSAFEGKLAGHKHPLLCANLRAKSGPAPTGSSIILERNGLRIGVLGVMVPMVTERMKTQGASAFLWDPPIATAQKVAAELRPHVDLLVALTHIGNRQDLELAATGAVDIILGGHSHTVIEQPIQVGRTWVCQAGSHGRYLGSYEWDGERLAGELIPL